MNPEQRFLELMDKLERCTDPSRRHDLLNEIARFAEQVHFSKEKWASFAARMAHVDG